MKEENCEIIKEKCNDKCPNHEHCPMRAKYLDKKPWLDYYCKQHPELCQRALKRKDGVDFDPEMFPDGST